MSSTMSSTKLQTRSAFIRQPARILLVDYQPPFDADSCEYLQQSLTDFFSLVTHLNGPSRAPLFGLFALGRYPENLFQLQHVKGNFPRLHSALEELRFFSKEITAITNSAEVLLQGLQDAVTQFKRHSQSLRQITPSTCQLEITVLTCIKASRLSRTIEKLSKQLDLGSIKKIQIAAVTKKPTEEDTTIEEGSSDQEISPTSSMDSGSLGCGLVDTVTLQKGEEEGDLQDETGPDKTILLKCDLHERLISPQFLPYRFKFEMNNEMTNLTSKASCNTRPCTSSTYPVHNLHISQLIKASAICESVLYGMPYTVRPTVCWKLDWEELEANQQYFYALSRALQERDIVALLQTQCSTNDILPIGHFLLLPSDGGSSMLLKSITASELLLPAEFTQPVEEPQAEALEVISACLDQLEIKETYNPLLVSCDLYKCLTSHALKGAGTANRQQKKRFQTPQRYQQTSKALSTNPDLRQPLAKPRAPRAPAKRVVFSKDTTAGKGSNSSKRQKVPAALDMYVTSPPEFPDDL
ncbi:meiosis 1 arrest protein isoform X1 [Nematostella vectensis]|uniref:meiosis 1 arrest protein isoform X1 n=1 Tax=Nematostella vectensis TaxID=45351 RepID=UPI002077563D|nr:meiosis 1 arrest protein isoform X1 [Nematostella vectensis]